MKINSILVIVIIILGTFFSCENSTINNIEEQQNTVEVIDYKLPNELKTGIEVVNGLLKFENADIAHKVFETLDVESEEYMKSLYLSCAHQDEYKDKVFSGEFDENEVFKKFENYYQFSSLRNKIDNEMRNWLKNEELNFKLKPSHVIADDAMQTILNEKGEYMIGNTIYKIDLSGNIYGIENADFEALKSLRNILVIEELSDEKSSIVIPSNVYLAQGNGNTKTIFNQRTKISLKSVNELDLKANYSDEKNWTYDEGDKYMNGRLTITNVVGISHFLKAETESYEYMGFWGGGWSRFNEHQYARVYGYYYMKDGEGDWELKWYADQSEWDDDKQAEAKESRPLDTAIRINNGDLHSTHVSDDYGETKYMTLEW